ncbi:hypothetical protein [Persephonella sp.]|nr:hypothetical protein [Persephonella sp.]
MVDAVLQWSQKQQKGIDTTTMYAAKEENITSATRRDYQQIKLIIICWI